MNCTCYVNIYGNVVHCPMHLACEDMYEALKVLLGIVAHNALPSEAKIRQAEKALSKADRK